MATNSPHHFVTGGVLLVVVVTFYMLLFRSVNHANEKLMPRFRELENRGPPETFSVRASLTL
ncbi:MAG: hypothetical protein H0U99_00720 [Chthoniobacterales bacterium]|nr:hypothetical protein [Chthoniobacterales bacterium]